MSAANGDGFELTTSPQTETRTRNRVESHGIEQFADPFEIPLASRNTLSFHEREQTEKESRRFALDFLSVNKFSQKQIGQTKNLFPTLFFSQKFQPIIAKCFPTSKIPIPQSSH